MQNAIAFVIIGLIYAVAKVILERKLAPLDATGDERELSDLAFARGCSVYDIFRTAGSTWNFSNVKIDGDFRDYLNEGRVPAYLHDYLKRQRHPGDRTYHMLIFSGGRPPYL